MTVTITRSEVTRLLADPTQDNATDVYVALMATAGKGPHTQVSNQLRVSTNATATLHGTEYNLTSPNQLTNLLVAIAASK